MGPENYYGYQQQNPYPQQEDPAAKKKRIIIGVGGILSFLMVVLIVLSMLLSTPSIRPDLTTIVAQQNEIARVAELGVNSEDARRATRNLAANVRSVSLTNLAAITAWGDKNFASEFSKAELGRELNEDTDAALLKAGAVNEYDETFEEAMLSLLGGTNKQILASYDVFEAYPDLQLILTEVGENNQALIEAISSE